MPDIDVLIAPDARVVLDRFLANIPVLEWMNDEVSKGHDLLRRPNFKWEDYFSEELREPNHKTSAARAAYEAKGHAFGGKTANDVLHAGSMGDWRDEEMAEPDHKNMWPQGYQTITK